MLAGPLNAAVRDLEALLPASPDAYPHNLDLAGGRVLVLRLDERGLPQRQLPRRPDSHALDAGRLAAGRRGHRGEPPGARAAAAAFHLPHAATSARRSSSRLLDETGGVLSLREPLLLRTLADAHDALGRPDSLLGPRPVRGAARHDVAALEPRLRPHARRRRQGDEQRRAAGGRNPLAPRRRRARSISTCARSPISRPCSAAPIRATDLRGHGPGRMRRLLAGRELPVEPLHALSLGRARRARLARRKPGPRGRRSRPTARACWRSISTSSWPTSRASSHASPATSASPRTVRCHRRGGRGPGSAPVLQGPAAAIRARGTRGALERVEAGESRRDRARVSPGSSAWAARTRAIAALLAEEYAMSAGAAADLELAASLEQAGRHADAESAYRRFIGGQPQDAVARFNFACFLRRRGRLDEALDEHQAALDLAIERPEEVLSNMAVIQAELRRDAAAKLLLERALASESRPHTGAVQPRSAPRGVRRPAARPGPVSAGSRAESRLARRARAHRPCRDGPRSRRRRREAAATRAAALEPPAAGAREPALRPRQGARRLCALRRGLRPVSRGQPREPAAARALRPLLGGARGRAADRGLRPGAHRLGDTGFGGAARLRDRHVPLGLDAIRAGARRASAGHGRRRDRLVHARAAVARPGRLAGARPGLPRSTSSAASRAPTS